MTPSGRMDAAEASRRGVRTFTIILYNDLIILYNDLIILYNDLIILYNDLIILY